MRSRVRAVLLLLLLGAVVLESINLVLPSLVSVVHRAYPAVALGSDGEVVYYDTHKERKPDGTMAFVRTLDTARNSARVLAPGQDVLRTAVLQSGRFWPVSPFSDGPGSGPGKPGFLIGYGHAHDDTAPKSPLEVVAEDMLQRMEAARRGIELLPGRSDGGTMTVLLAPNLHAVRGIRMPIRWGVEQNRLVCRDTAGGRVLAGIGPDGYRTGEGAEDGEAFGQVDLIPLYPRYGIAGSFRLLLLDATARRFFLLSTSEKQMEARGLPADSTDLVPIEVDVTSLHPATPESGTEAMPPLLTLDGRRHLLVFLLDGSVIADLDLEPGEYWFSTAGALWADANGLSPNYLAPGKEKRGTVAVETGFAMVRADEEHRRLRLFRPGAPDIVRDVVLKPTRPSEVLLANLAASLALLRPPPLVVASTLSRSPPWGWWWRDPWLAGGSYPGWLILSPALAVFLAWRARKAARERCATVRAVRFWTATVFLLGLIGYLWMRLVLPRVPVEPVGGGRRAVNLDASPTTAAPWPEPAPLGIEVFS